MTSTLKTMLLAAAAATLIGLGAVAAHAGDLDDLDPSQAAALLSSGGSDPVSEAVEAAATEAVIDTLLGDGGDEE